MRELMINYILMFGSKKLLRKYTRRDLESMRDAILLTMYNEMRDAYTEKVLALA